MYYTDYDIVFQEVPDETTLALSISGCPFRCHGCHSPHLWQRDAGIFLSYEELDRLIRRYKQSITCVCFMGGDADHYALNSLMAYIRKHYHSLRIAWYSGADTFPYGIRYDLLSYIKIGHYDSYFGPLSSPITNQRFYKATYVSISGGYTDITEHFQRK